ncbi:MAG: 3-hydroxyacyl-ACP dehydratase FabZ [Thermoleophilia bacterium]
MTQLNREQIKKIIPHRDPFLFLDEIIELIPGERAVAIKEVRAEEPHFEGHFPGRPVMPGVLMIEALAQAGAVAVLSVPENSGKLVLFAGIDGVRFKRMVVPGDTLRLEVEMTRMRGTIGKGEASATVDGELACKATLTFMIVE